MLRVAWLSASMFSCASLRKSRQDLSANWMWRPIARSGQSIWTRMPAFVTASYSTRIASAIA